ncbi:GIY-YIG nuclease family protein [Paenibacillus rhizovicinus]|uniref:GIY-YIG nuclease family protein n=1 Tax=Paenibacillus rhizovicinus TaxID=2704463 RepID=A0A6C0P834_9BACL|nr:GIY-YIG nuclease family protein [Paenibacillus rhizovicinus]QHW34747.1 GIY-YIG nuclease family protein [Paenibacillus rhizovicinus]
MDKNKRKELLEAYKQVKTYMGIIQITNRTNGKIYVDAYPNLKNKWTSIQAQLNMGRFPNAGLQQEWKTHGPDAFAYEVLDQKEADDIADIKWEMKMLEKKWMEKLQPYGEQGYHKPRAQ